MPVVPIAELAERAQHRRRHAEHLLGPHEHRNVPREPGRLPLIAAEQELETGRTAGADRTDEADVLRPGVSRGVRTAHEGAVELSREIRELAISDHDGLDLARERARVEDL